MPLTAVRSHPSSTFNLRKATAEKKNSHSQTLLQRGTSLSSRARTAAYTFLTSCVPTRSERLRSGTCEKVPQAQIDPRDDPPTYAQATSDESPPSYVEDTTVSNPLAADARDVDESIFGLQWDIHELLDDISYSRYSSSSPRSSSQEHSMAFALSLHALLGESERNRSHGNLSRLFGGV